MALLRPAAWSVGKAVAFKRRGVVEDVVTGGWGRVRWLLAGSTMFAPTVTMDKIGTLKIAR